jgi:hypothetical protein
MKLTGPALPLFETWCRCSRPGNLSLSFGGLGFSMDEAIRSLLDVLEAAEYAGTPLTDTDVRERLFDVVDQGFIHGVPGYEVPLSLLDDCGGAENQKASVREALSAFLKSARQHAAAAGLNTPGRRRAAFLSCRVTSSSSATDVCEFFGAA